MKHNGNIYAFHFFFWPYSFMGSFTKKENTLGRRNRDIDIFVLLFSSFISLSSLYSSHCGVGIKQSLHIRYMNLSNLYASNMLLHKVNFFLVFYHKGFSDYCLHLYCYFHNVSADMSSGFLQVFVELRNLHGTSNYVLYWI